MNIEIYERLMLNIDLNGPINSHAPELGKCWIWLLCKNEKGYGKISVGNGKSKYVHRVSWELFNEQEIPKSITIDHLCRNRSCARPDHLECVTLAENIKRGSPYRPKKRKDYCVNSHERTGSNVRFDRKGHLACRVCAKNDASRRRREQGMREWGSYIPRHNVSISESDVLKIRELHDTENLSYLELAVMFGVSRSSIGRYIRRERYADI